MNKEIPIPRQALYLGLFSLIPTVLVLIHLFTTLGVLSTLDERNQWVEMAAEERALQEGPNQAVRQVFQNPDRFYVDKHLESLSLRQAEVQLLEQSLRNRVLPSQEVLEKRLDYLKKENRLRFAETGRQNYPDFQEFVETLQKPVEIDLNDLSTLLQLIEGPPNTPSGKPHLIITDLILERKRVFSDNEALLLNLKLLKREYL